jgi:hypothetical protein
MSHSKLDGWQICLIVTALVVLAEAAVNFLLKRDLNIILHEQVRTGALGVLVVITVIAFVVALGPSLADELSSVAAAVTAVVALWLTYRSYQSIARSSSDPSPAPSSDPSPAPSSDPSPAHSPDEEPDD